MKKHLVPWIVLIICDVLFLLIMVVTNFNMNIVGIALLVLGSLSLFAIFRLKGLNVQIKAGMALKISFRYFVLGIFALMLPHLGTSEVLINTFLALYLISMIGSSIALRHALKEKTAY